MKQVRVLNNKTQKEVADSLGISERQYRNYEKMVSVPNIKVGLMFANLFNTDVNNIIFFK